MGLSEFDTEKIAEALADDIIGKKQDEIVARLLECTNELDDELQVAICKAALKAVFIATRAAIYQFIFVLSTAGLIHLDSPFLLMLLDGMKDETENPQE